MLPSAFAEISSEAPKKNDVDQFRKNKEFREEFGLKSDNPHIENVIAEKSGMVKFGVDLTRDEELELESRLKTTSIIMREAKKYLIENNSDDSFASLYVDHKNGSTIHISFKKNLSQLEAKLKALKDINRDQAKIQYHEVKYSEKELDDVHAAIDQKVADLKSRGVNVVSVDTNIVNNRLDIGLEDFSDGTIAVFKNIINGADPSMFHFFKDKPRREEWTSGTYTRPVQGGLRIIGSGGACSTAFSATDSSGSYYTITAGHCINYSGEQWTQGVSLFGYANRWVRGNKADVAAIKIDPSNSTPWLYAYNTSNYLKFRFYQYAGYDSYGDMACIAAGNSDNTNCGTIKSTNWSGYVGTVYQYNMRTASYSSIGGDSGSTVYGIYYGNWYIMGIHNASGGIYTHVQNAWEALGFTPVVEP